MGGADDRGGRSRSPLRPPLGVSPRHDETNPVKVTICVNYECDGVSQMLCRGDELAVAPIIGDFVEILPESEDCSTSHEQVERRYVQTDSVEVHMRYRSLSATDVEALIAAGFRPPAQIA